MFHDYLGMLSLGSPPAEYGYISNVVSGDSCHWLLTTGAV